MALLLILIIYSVTFSYNTVQSLDHQIFLILKKQPSEVTIDFSQSIGELKKLINGITPMAIINNNLLLIIMIGPIISSTIGAIIVGSEFKQRTVVIKASHYGWTQSVISKIMLLLALSIALPIFVTILSYIEGYIVFNWAKDHLHHNELVTLKHIKIKIFSQIIVSIFTLFFYGSIGLFFSLISRSTLIGGIVAFLIPYIDKFLASFSLESLFPTTWLSILIKNNFTLFENSFASPTYLPNTDMKTSSVFLLFVCLILIVCFANIYVSKNQKI